MSSRDPDARCCVCDVRLAGLAAEHEDECIRRADRERALQYAAWQARQADKFKAAKA